MPKFQFFGNEVQWVLNYRDLDYHNPHNTRIDKKVPSPRLLGIPRNTGIPISTTWVCTYFIQNKNCLKLNFSPP